MAELIPVEDALRKILSAFEPNPEEFCALEDSYGRVISQGILATTDLPPFTNSSMDGFAVRAEDTQGASLQHPVALTADYDIPAGFHPTKIIQPGHAARIMTGAPLPAGANAVVQVESTNCSRYEDTAAFPFLLKIFSEVAINENVRPQGMDVKQGQKIISPSTRLRPQEVSALAAMGILKVPVYKKPKIAVLSTGDELVTPEEPLSPGKIHESNSYSLIGLARDLGCEVINLGIVPDDKREIQKALDSCIDLGINLIATSAGVSVGAYDFVKDVIESAGRIDFWRVNMRPGKPIAFGNYRSIPLLGLAGNPVSSFVGFLVFIRPAILKMSGIQDLAPHITSVIIDTSVESDGRQSYLRANSYLKDGKWYAHPAAHQGSGNVLSMVNSNTLLIIPPGVKSLPINSHVDAWILE